jgi:hypothetical protein
MKKTFTLLVAMIFSGASVTYAWQNRLTISSNIKNTLSIQIDGKFYQVNKNDAALVINDQRPGTRNIKVYQQINNKRGGEYNNRNRRWNNETFMQLLYNGNLYIKDGYDVDITINRFGKAFVDEQPINRYVDDEDRDDLYDDHNHNGYRQPMNKRSFVQLKQSIGRESFDDAKMNIAKAAFANSYLSSYQVKDLLSLFSFENSKLDIAKYCYRFATDPGNYFVVADALTYSSSKTALMKYIQENK